MDSPLKVKQSGKCPDPEIAGIQALSPGWVQKVESFIISECCSIPPRQEPQKSPEREDRRKLRYWIYSLECQFIQESCGKKPS